MWLCLWRGKGWWWEWEWEWEGEEEEEEEEGWSALKPEPPLNCIM